MTITTKRKTANGHKVTHLSICNGGKGFEKVTAFYKEGRKSPYRVSSTNN
jgi:hypothetical protein